MSALFEAMSEKEQEDWAQYISHCVSGQSSCMQETGADDDDIFWLMNKFECFTCSACENWCPPEEESSQGSICENCVEEIEEEAA